MNKKSNEIVKYINSQRKNGHKDGRIRVHMEVHGHSPEMLNNYFLLADKELEKQQATKLFAMVVIGIFLFSGVVLGLQNSSLTGAASWFSGSSSYTCGDDYPADSDNVMDLSSCAGDTSSTKNYLFCYMNNTESADEISPLGNNDDWYSTTLGEDVSLISSIDSVALFESAFVLPYSIARKNYDNIDCFSWDHGVTRDSDWHQCNASTTEPPNLVFYYADRGDGLNVSYGGLSTSLSLNSSYYLCYDELSCITSTTACDENANSYCVGRLDTEDGSSWYPCDTTFTAPYYRCCEGGCEGVEMMCGERIELPDGSRVTFEECTSDETSGCCSQTTDCVFDGECYSEEEEIDLGTYTFVCSDTHWCPEGFEYDEGDQLCAPTQAACYDAIDTSYCNYILGTESTDSWEADTSDTACIRPDFDSAVYNESCVYSGSYGGADYYFYQDISWY